MFNNILPTQYYEFKQIVDDMRTGVTKPKYLGGGSESNVFEAVLNDKKYAVKFALGRTALDRPRNQARATQRKIDAGLRGLGIIGLEQIQAASVEDGVAIYELVEGITAATMTKEDISQVTSQEFQRFYDSIDQAAEIGIEFDPWNQDGSNVIYTPNIGFTLIDYFVGYAKTSPEDSRVNGLLALGPTTMKLINIFGQ